MIDLHCHILPGIDDGAGSEEIALQMANIAVRDGITKIITTPHFHVGVYENGYDQVVQYIDKLKQLFDEKNISLALYPGQEVYLDRNILEYFKSGRIKGINGSKYMLIELPMDRCPNYALDMLYELKLLGMVPIIAHPERYQYIIDDLTGLNPFIEEGCLIQVNATSIHGGFGKSVRKTVNDMIKHGTIDFIASDAHSIRGRTPEVALALMAAEEIHSGISNIVASNLNQLLVNGDISPQYDKIKTRRRLFDLIK